VVQTPANLAPHHGQQPSRRNRRKAGERRGIPYTPGRARTLSHFLSHFVVPNAASSLTAHIPQEAVRFTRHAHRTTLTTHDIDADFCALEPLYGHVVHMSTTFRRVVPQGVPPVYLVEDEEIDFDKVIKEEKIVLLKSR